MNLLPALAHAFGVDADRLEAIVAAYESPGIILPPAGDRLTLIEARWRERGCPDGDFAWLLAECKRLRAEVAATLDEALNSGDGVYRP